MRGHSSSHYFTSNYLETQGERGFTSIVADIPLGVVEAALEKSREKARERRFIPSTDYQKQLGLRDSLERKDSTGEGSSATNQ